MGSGEIENCVETGTANFSPQLRAKFERSAADAGSECVVKWDNQLLKVFGADRGSREESTLPKFRLR